MTKNLNLANSPVSVKCGESLGFKKSGKWDSGTWIILSVSKLYVVNLHKQIRNRPKNARRLLKQKNIIFHFSPKSGTSLATFFWIFSLFAVDMENNSFEFWHRDDRNKNCSWKSWSKEMCLNPFKSPILVFYAFSHSGTGWTLLQKHWTFVTLPRTEE